MRGKVVKVYLDKLDEEIEIDLCIATEIQWLNNVAGVTTTYSCCGHKYTYNYIRIKKRQKTLMKQLGYKVRKESSEDGLSFIPKSACDCKNTNLKCPLCSNPLIPRVSLKNKNEDWFTHYNCAACSVQLAHGNQTAKY